MSFQDKNSCIAADVKIPASCCLGDFVKIYSGVTIGENVEIGDFCVIGSRSVLRNPSNAVLHIPDNSIIRSHSVIYAGSTFGSRLMTGHHVVIRERTVAGQNLRVGNFSDIQGDCEIGDFCRFHGYVHVGKGSRIGNFVWLFSLVTLTNDPMPPSHVQSGVTIEDGVVVCVGSTLFPGCSIGRGTMIAANTPVRGRIPAAILFSNASPSIPITKVRSIEHQLQLPWPNHYRDAYPDDAQERLLCLRTAILEDARRVGRAADEGQRHQ
jgi:UDP-3-O-[3-hydroxymyristoyl] glucosamine N-acyltransferase